MIFLICCWILFARILLRTQNSKKKKKQLNIQKTKIMAPGPITLWQIDVETVTDYFGWVQKSMLMVTAAMKLKDTCSLEEKL